MSLSPDIILHGLKHIDRETLCVFLSLFEDSRATNIFCDKILDIKDKLKNLYRSDDIDTKDIQNQFSSRLKETSEKIRQSGIDNDALRCALLEHLLAAFDMQDNMMLTPIEGKKTLKDLADRFCLEISKQTHNADRGVLDRINPFANSKAETSILSFDEAINSVLAKTIAHLLESDNTASKEMILNLKNNLQTLDKSILKEIGINELTDQSLKKILTTSGGMLGLIGAVELAGFNAYIFAAQASAFIPFVGGKTLVSMLFVFANPLTAVAAIIATGVMAHNKLNKTIQTSFATIITALLALIGLSKKGEFYASFKIFTGYVPHLHRAVDYGLLQNLSVQKKLDKAGEYIRKVNLPIYSARAEVDNILEKDIQIIKNTDDKDGATLIKICDNDPSTTKENIAIGVISFADFIYDQSFINPDVIQAADFAYTKEDIGDVFSFSLFSEKFNDVSKESLAGTSNHLMGYTAEIIAANCLLEKGHIVEFPEKANQAGFDLLVDGNPFQVKCLSSIEGLKAHFEKYPDIPVIANFELSKIMQDIQPEWSHLVFFLDGYTHELADTLVKQTLNASSTLGDYAFIPAISIVSTFKNTLSFLKKEHSLQSASFNIVLDTISRGSMATLGGYAGGGIGLLLFGPAGAYIVGGISGYGGAMSGKFLLNKFDQVIDPERETSAEYLSHTLLEKLNLLLKEKIKLIDGKVRALPSSEFSNYIEYRLKWQKVFLEILIHQSNDLLNNTHIQGMKKLIKALDLCSKSTIHPFQFKKEYENITDFLNEKSDRLQKTGSFLKSNYAKMKQAIF
jgi:hypothetical protein